MGVTGKLATAMTTSPLYLLFLLLLVYSAVDGTTSEAETPDCYFDPTEDQVTVVADGYGAVEGCYTLSEEYSSLDRKIYTNDGGEVINGSTIAILGTYVSVCVCDMDWLLLSVVVLCTIVQQFVLSSALLSLCLSVFLSSPLRLSSF